ncbi:MAG: CBS domain-containing protein [Planctomycetaceae bacterium]|nr:CBS domain-containing protein [Planctomycetaceae bacterium]
MGVPTNDLCEMMVQRNLQSIPVIDGNGHFVGTVTIQTLLQSLADKSRTTNPFDNLTKPQESSCPVETSPSTIYESLTRDNKSHYWITNNSMPVGMVTAENLLR